MARKEKVSLDAVADAASAKAEDVIKKFEAWDTEQGFILGSVFDLVPSGQFYSVWADNVDSDDLKKDSVFWEHFTEDMKANGLDVTLGGPHGTMVIIRQG